MAKATQPNPKKKGYEKNSGIIGYEKNSGIITTT